MSDPDTAPLDLVRRYLAALAAGAAGEELRGFFTPDATQTELPNRLHPTGGTSTLATLLERSEQGRALLASQSYEIVSALAQGDRVAVEATWSGTLAVPLGSLPAGARMRAHFAMFFTLEGGRIRTQRNYDCFEPF